MNLNGYRKRPNNKCYICESEIKAWTFWKLGITAKMLVNIWEGIGARVCVSEFDYHNIIPLNDNEDFFQPESLIKRISGIVRFEQALRKKGESRWPEKVFDTSINFEESKV